MANDIYGIGVESKAGSCRKASLAIFLLFLGVGLVIGGLDVVVSPLFYIG